MLKQISVCLLLAVSFLQAQGQDKARKVTILPELGLHYNSNGADVTDSGMSSGSLRSVNKPGFSVGLVLRRQTKSGIVLLPAMGLRLDRQKLVCRTMQGNAYLPEEAVTFTNVYFDLKMMIGYNINFKGNNSLDLTAGLLALYSLRNNKPPYKVTYSGYNDPVNGKPQQYISTYRYVSWGDERKDLDNLLTPFVPNFMVRATYLTRDLLPGNRLLSIGFECSARIFIHNGQKAANWATLQFFDRNRELIGSSRFRDRFFSTGLTVGLSL